MFNIVHGMDLMTIRFNKPTFTFNPAFNLVFVTSASSSCNTNWNQKCRTPTPRSLALFICEPIKERCLAYIQCKRPWMRIAEKSPWNSRLSELSRLAYSNLFVSKSTKRGHQNSVSWGCEGNRLGEYGMAFNETSFRVVDFFYHVLYF